MFEYDFSCVSGVNCCSCVVNVFFFFFQAEDGIRDHCVTGVQTCALPILCSAALARRSPTSMLPLASACTGTTRSPAITALAGFVPCADVGIKQVVRCPSPRER